ncbi:MAG: hypothetical protein ABW046_01865 [Actinoplanes sp.]
MRRNLIGASVVAGLSVLAWVGWLGWDSEYQVDAITGSQSGPYEAWQVAGCAVTLLGVLVGALVARVHPVIASVALTLAFTVAWTWQAAATDDSGMFGVGAILLLAGLSSGTALVSVIVTALRSDRPGRTAAA